MSLCCRWKESHTPYTQRIRTEHSDTYIKQCYFHLTAESFFLECQRLLDFIIQGGGKITKKSPKGPQIFIFKSAEFVFFFNTLFGEEGIELYK